MSRFCIFESVPFFSFERFDPLRFILAIPFRTAHRWRLLSSVGYKVEG
jgi:hypothetical protein